MICMITQSGCNILAPSSKALKSMQVRWLPQILWQVLNQAVDPWQVHHLLRFLLFSYSGICCPGISGMLCTFTAPSQRSETCLFCCKAWHQKIHLSTASQMPKLKYSRETPVQHQAIPTQPDVCLQNSAVLQNSTCTHLTHVQLTDPTR